MKQIAQVHTECHAQRLQQTFTGQHCLFPPLLSPPLPPFSPSLLPPTELRSRDENVLYLIISALVHMELID